MTRNGIGARLAKWQRVPVELKWIWVFPLSACVSAPSESRPAQIELPRPVLVRAIAQSVRQDTEATTAEDLNSVYEVRLDVQQVLAGAPEGSMESEIATVRLAASNAGYFGRGAELVVLLDPKRINSSTPLYWRRFTRFACVESTELEKSGLTLDESQALSVGGDTCLFYGP